LVIQPILVPSVDTVDDLPGRFSAGKPLFADVAMGPASLPGGSRASVELSRPGTWRA
jgi:hypothetical protein